MNAKRPKSNLTASQRKGLAYLKKENIAVVPYDKGVGFVTIEKDKLVEKAEAQFKNVTLDTRNTTESYERKIQAKIRDLHKQGKIDDRTKKQIYPSGSTTPSVSVAIKAHKAAKDFPARNIINHVNAA